MIFFPGSIIPPSLLAALQNSAQNNHLGRLMAQTRLPAPTPAPPDPVAYVTAAKLLTNTGERIVHKIMLWREIYALPVIGWFFARTLDALADRLESTTDEIERWLEKAEAA